MNLIDTHAHLTSKEYDENLDSIIQNATTAGVSCIVTVGTDLDDSKKAIAIADKYDNIYASAGFHPHYANDVTSEALDEIASICRQDSAVAIGEIGLDYYYDIAPREIQRAVFIKQLEIAASAAMPVIIHTRESFDDAYQILRDYSSCIPNIVIHCFSEGMLEAEKCVEQGWYVSFTGVLTFAKAEKTRQAARAVPVERLMIETDCPYMSPAPMRKQKINEPALIVHIAAKLAEVKGLSKEDISSILTKNSEKFFRI